MAFLQSHVTHGARQVYAGEVGIKRTKYALQLMGNPQEKLKIVHIAGTSGKGSTAYCIANLLEAHGFKTGLNVSPHIVDIRERFQIHRQFISEEAVISCLNELIPYFEKTATTDYGYPTYFEILTIMSFYIFHKHNVDYAVMETGMGGLLDATNTVLREDKLVILTSIGYDHVNVLGKTLPEIAANKAGIIKNRNNVLAASPIEEVKEVFDSYAQKANTKISYITTDTNYAIDSKSSSELTFDLDWEDLHIKNLTLNTPALFQVQNVSMAIVAVYNLSLRDHFTLNETWVRDVVATFRVPARMEFFHIGNKLVITDGAHNEQKMQAFVESIQQGYPHQKFDLLVAFKASKDIETLVAKLIPLAHHVTVTSFFHLDKQFTFLSAKPDEVAHVFQRSGYTNIHVMDKPEDALQSLLEKSDRNIIITGSFYLIAEVYDKLRKLSVDNTIFI